MRLNLGIAAIAATFAVASPAAAQFTATAQDTEARGVVLSAQSLSNTRMLNFGTVSVSGAGGVVTVPAELSGTRTTSSPDLVLLAGGYSSAIFQGYGAPNQNVTLTLDPAITLIGPNAATDFISGTLSIDDSSFVLGATGRFESYVGGAFTVAGNQAPGLYTATFDLTADFQ
jgi:hypothetical protein